MVEKNEQQSAVRRELANVEPTMVELREWRCALAAQTERMREAARSLEMHRKQGKGANQR